MQVIVKIFKAVILFAVLCEDMLRFSPWGRMFGCVREQIIEENIWTSEIYRRKSKNLEFLKLRSSYTGGAIKSTMMTWTGHVVCADIMKLIRDIRFFSQ
jgi:hypothetical protein